MQKAMRVLNVFVWPCVTGCLAETLILFKGFTCNQNNLCPALSQHIRVGDMLETADESSVEPLCSLLVEVLLCGNALVGE